MYAKQSVFINGIKDVVIVTVEALSPKLKNNLNKCKGFEFDSSHSSAIKLFQLLAKVPGLERPYSR